MADDWLDELAQRDRRRRREAVRPVEEAASVESVATRAEVDPDQHRRRKTTIAMTAGSVGLVAVVGFGVWGVSSSLGNGDEQAQQAGSTGVSQGPTVSAAAQHTSTAASARVDPATKTVVAGPECDADSDEVAIEDAEEDSLRQVIGDFEKAYFAHDDAGVRASVTEDSSMAKQDWKKVLPEAAPKGTTWCVTMAPVEGDQVDVDLMMAPPGKKETTYQQVVKGEKTAKGWRIDSISARKDK